MNDDSVHPSQWKIEDLVNLVWMKVVGLLGTTTDPNLIPALKGIKEEIERWRANAPDAMSNDEMRSLCIEALG